MSKFLEALKDGLKDIIEEETEEEKKVDEWFKGLLDGELGNHIEAAQRICREHGLSFVSVVGCCNSKSYPSTMAFYRGKKMHMPIELAKNCIKDFNKMYSTIESTPKGSYLLGKLEGMKEAHDRGALDYDILNECSDDDKCSDKSCEECHPGGSGEKED